MNITSNLTSNLIDITDPQNFAKYVSENNYVNYANRFGFISFHVETPINGDVGWWGGEHFKADDTTIKMQLGEAPNEATLIQPTKGEGW